jgi:hypothetical protein
MSQERTPSPDPDGVRIVRERVPIPKAALLLVAGLAFALAFVFLPRPSAGPVQATGSTAPASATDGKDAPSVIGAAPPVATPRTAPVDPAIATPTASTATTPGVAPRSVEDNDIATRFRPGDEAPSAAELIQALRDAGETGGIAAFNPPGTSPPLTGLAVPADFPLPPGYVRHHQWTDEGEPVEAILMFAPDFVLRDAEGREVPLPENRVVPPELAPPGLPIRPVEIPGE